MVTMIPLKDLVPHNHTAAECRRILRESGEFEPVGGRWVFPKRKARQVIRLLGARLH